MDSRCVYVVDDCDRILFPALSPEPGLSPVCRRSGLLRDSKLLERDFQRPVSPGGSSRAGTPVSPPRLGRKAAFYPLSGALALLRLLFPARYTRSADLLTVGGIYVLAKFFEMFDRSIYDLGHIVSGHTLKDLTAALSAYWGLRMLKLRIPCGEASKRIHSLKVV
jgi:hypothetical protein